MDALKGSYERLRDQVRELTVSLHIETAEFEAMFPERAESPQRDPISFAKVAATPLRHLEGSLNGVIETVVIEEQLSEEQIAPAREPARKPLGFA
jgi:hypothetical protein